MFFKRIAWWKKFTLVLFGVFGIVWLFLEPAGLFFPDQFDWGLKGYLGLLFVCILISFITNFPKKTISIAISSTQDYEIQIKEGDLFEEQGHIVIGINDVFDTEPARGIIKPTSVQGQFLSKIYSDNLLNLDRDIQSELSISQAQGISDPQKTIGKQIRYPLGTVVSLGTSTRKFFLSAYARMGHDRKCSSDPAILNKSLNMLWEEIRLKAQGEPVSLPVLGSDLARIGLSRMALMKLIVMSFVIASRQQFVTKKLTIVVHPSDMPSVDIYSLETFLQELRSF